jgi:hypothetical protein
VNLFEVEWCQRGVGSVNLRESWRVSRNRCLSGGFRLNPVVNFDGERFFILRGVG